MYRAPENVGRAWSDPTGPFRMARSQRLVDALKRELKVRGITYRELAVRLELAESTVKQTLASGSRMTLERLDAILDVLGLDIAELLRQSEARESHLSRLSIEVEQALVADDRLVLATYLVVSGYGFEDIVSRYRVSDTELIRLLAALDRMGIAELLPGNRIRSRLATDFAWQPDGPIERYFRTRVQGRFLESDFGARDASRVVRTADITAASLDQLRARVESIGRLFDDLAREDRRRPVTDRRGTLMVLAIKPWGFDVFKSFERDAADAAIR